MEKGIALAMKDHYLGQHLVEGDLESFELIKEGHGHGQGYIRFLFDCNDSTLIVTGDYGDAVFKWYSSRNTLDQIAEYSTDLRYFVGKCTASSRVTYVYDENQAKKDIAEWLDNMGISDDDFGIDSDQVYWPWDNKQDFINDLVSNIDYYRGFSFDNVNANSFSDISEESLQRIAEDWWEVVYDFGKIVNPVFELYSHALNLGVKWLKKQKA